MACDYLTAIDEMFAQVKAQLGASSPASMLLSYDIDLRWPGVEIATKPDPLKCWARVSQQGVAEGQASFADQVSGPAKRRYDPTGLIYIQIFAPMAANGMDLGRKLAKIARDAFRGQETASGVVFRNVRINELANDGKSYRFNVVAEYEYDDIA